MSENQLLDAKGGCVVYNLNRTLKQEGGLTGGLDIQYQEMNFDLPLLGMNVCFYDSRGNIPFIDMGEFGSLAYGVCNKKLGPLYASRCTKKQSLDSSTNLSYTYVDCMGRCEALRMYEKCEDVIRVLDNYIS